MSHGIRVEDIAWQAFQAGVRAENGLGINERTQNERFIIWWTKHRDQGCALPACEKCGHDPSARIAATWRFLIERGAPSLNDRIVNAGPTAWKYRRERTAWGWELRAVRLLQRIPIAKGRRRLTLTRVYNGRQKERDRDNLIGGMKAVVDAITLEGLIVDDSPQMAEINYEQMVGTPVGLVVLLEEFA